MITNKLCPLKDRIITERHGKEGHTDSSHLPVITIEHCWIVKCRNKINTICDMPQKDRLSRSATNGFPTLEADKKVVVKVFRRMGELL